MLSVIAPCLNEAKNLPYFLKSLETQTFKDFELIVVDGGSKDKSRSIIDDYRSVFSVLGLINFERNLGVCRNFGAKAARGNILLHTNSDAVFPSSLFSKAVARFEDPKLMALSGRTVPFDGGVLACVGYSAFDLLRWFFCKVGKFSPSGNMLFIRKDFFNLIGGFPLAVINEDGELGEKIKLLGAKTVFDRGLYAGHFAKRFKGKGFKTLMFYSYVFGNFNPIFKKILTNNKIKSSQEFNVK